MTSSVTLRAVRRTPLLLAALVLLVCAVAAPAASAKAPKKAPHGFAGVVFDRDVAFEGRHIVEREFARMAQNGVESVRTTFVWSMAQHQPNGPFTWQQSDPLVRQASLRNIELMPILIYAPRWARSKKERLASPPRGTKNYAKYVAAVVDRYGKNGTFWRLNPDVPKRPIKVWQIWNEPQLTSQWDNGSKGVRADKWERPYVRLLRAARKAIKNRDPGAKIALAGLTTNSWTQLNKVYRVGGRGLFDIVALHPYTNGPKGVITIVKKVRQVMKANKNTKPPIWITEASWPAAAGRVKLNKNQRTLVTNGPGMTKRVGALFSLMNKQRKRLNIQRVFWYAWASPYKGDGLFDYSGLGQYRSGEFKPRKPLAAFKRAARKLQGCSKTEFGVCR